MRAQQLPMAVAVSVVREALAMKVAVRAADDRHSNEVALIL